MPEKRGAALPWWRAKCARWRSAAAAQEIKALIDASGARVEAGSSQVLRASATMDDVTQQNAAMVEQAAAASLQEQAALLVSLVDTFVMPEDRVNAAA